MTTISSTNSPFGDMTRYQKPIKVSDTQVAAVAIHPVELTSAQKAERAQKQADMAAVVAAADKRMQEAEKNKTVENNGIYTSNVSSLSLENAKKNLGFAQLMIERHEDVGSTFHGRYGDTELKSATEWEAALKDYIGKQEAAASMYSKVQEMS